MRLLEYPQREDIFLSRAAICLSIEFNRSKVKKESSNNLNIIACTHARDIRKWNVKELNHLINIVVNHRYYRSILSYLLSVCICFPPTVSSSELHLALDL